jgi:hypothetical protein
MRQCLVCGRKFLAPNTLGRPPETCSLKCRKQRKSDQREDSRQRARRRGIPAHMHGTSTGATLYLCHCTECRKWWREYQRARRKAQKAAAVHG